MRQEAFKAGSEFPPCEAGKLRIYSMRFCPYAERALLVANALSIPHEIVNINLSEKPSWYFEKNPEGSVPTAERDGEVICGSLIVADYLDETTSGSLTPADPYQRAKDKMVVERFNKVGSHFFSVYGSLLDGDATKIEELYKAMEWAEQELSTRGTTFYAGSVMGMIDLMIWPWLERIQSVSAVPFPKDRFPMMSAWSTRMRQESVIQKTCLEPDLMKRFYADYRLKKIDYDMGL